MYGELLNNYQTPEDVAGACPLGSLGLAGACQSQRFAFANVAVCPFSGEQRFLRPSPIRSHPYEQCREDGTEICDMAWIAGTGTLDVDETLKKVRLDEERQISAHST